VEQRSNLAKWIPREKASPRLYTLLAEHWAQITGQSETNTMNRVRKEYRHVLSQLHREYIESPQSTQIKEAPHIVPLSECIAQLTQQEGRAKERTEKQIQVNLDTRMPKVCSQPKNLLLVLDPSPLGSQYAKQMAVMLQTWYVMRQRPQFLLLDRGHTRFVDWSNQYATYAEIVQALWKIHIDYQPFPNALSTFFSTVPLPSRAETAEKCTWLLLSDFSAVPVHPYIQKRKAIIPHMVYIDSSDALFLSAPPTKTFPCRMVDARCTMLSATENGLSPNQWTQLVLKTQSPFLRNTSCWDFLQAVLTPYRAMLQIVDKDRMDVC